MPMYRFAVLKNETETDHMDWLKACENFKDQIDVDVIDIISNDWYEKVTQKSYDFFLARPPGRIAYYKQLYDERVYIINHVLKFPIYPTLNEILFYENKRFLSYYLKAYNIPHPNTSVYYSREEALSFLRSTSYPFVAKTNIGAGGSGVKILKNIQDAEKYIDQAFSGGITRSFFPNFRKGSYLKRLKNRIGQPKKTIEYFKEKKNAATIDPQKYFVIFQEFIKSDYEWRCVVVDNSYFGHKKLRSLGEMMSGTSRVSWEIPDKKLLDLLKRIIDNNGFWSLAIDLFYNEERGYLVNELQCFWGSKNQHQMIKDGTSGRFVNTNGNWIFEDGNFNQNNSFDLRIQHVLKLLNNNEKAIQ